MEVYFLIMCHWSAYLVDDLVSSLDINAPPPCLTYTIISDFGDDDVQVLAGAICHQPGTCKCRHKHAGCRVAVTQRLPVWQVC